MLELMIEQWRNLDGSSHFLWSVWEDGARIGMGRAATTPAAAETEGLSWCHKAAGRAPDRVTRL